MRILQIMPMACKTEADKVRKREHQRDKYWRFRLAGKCTRCGAERDRPDRMQCAECRDVQAYSHAKYKMVHEEEWEAKGLCRSCLKRDAEPDRAHCRHCIDQACARKKAIYAFRKANDICTNCGKFHKDKTSRCKACLAIVAKIDRRRKANK